MKGLIALDIDGTITGKEKQVPYSVEKYLGELHEEGWVIALITGRSYQFTRKTINFSFPYLLATQHGANIFEMPAKKVLVSHYLDTSVIIPLDEIYKRIPEGYLIYADYTQGDICYYRSSDFSKEGLAYLNLLKNLTPLPWKQFSTVGTLEQQSFPVIKCFGSEEDMLEIQTKLATHPVSTFVIRDPIDPSKHLCLITAKEADKGKTVRWIQWVSHIEGPVITAGNDMNDVPLLEAATIAISFDDSPQSLLIHADIVVPQNEGEGIIEGLKKAFALC